VNTGGSQIYVGSSPPASASDGDIWIDNSGNEPALVMASDGGFVGDNYTYNSAGSAITHTVQTQYDYVQFYVYGGHGANGESSGGSAGQVTAKIPTSNLPPEIDIYVAEDGFGTTAGSGYHSGGSGAESSDDANQYAQSGGGGGSSAITDTSGDVIIEAGGGGGGGAVDADSGWIESSTAGGNGVGESANNAVAGGSTAIGGAGDSVSGDGTDGDTYLGGNQRELAAGGGGGGHLSGEGGNTEQNITADPDEGAASGGGGGGCYINGSYAPESSSINVTSTSEYVEIVYLQS